MSFAYYISVPVADKTVVLARDRKFPMTLLSVLVKNITSYIKSSIKGLSEEAEKGVSYEANLF